MNVIFFFPFLIIISCWKKGGISIQPLEKYYKKISLYIDDDNLFSPPLSRKNSTNLENNELNEKEKYIYESYASQHKNLLTNNVLNLF